MQVINNNPDDEEISRERLADEIEFEEVKQMPHRWRKAQSISAFFDSHSVFPSIRTGMSCPI